jgi:hypothetical protein
MFMMLLWTFKKVPDILPEQPFTVALVVIPVGAATSITAANALLGTTNAHAAAVLVVILAIRAKLSTVFLSRFHSGKCSTSENFPTVCIFAIVAPRIKSFKPDILTSKTEKGMMICFLLLERRLV